MRRFSLGVAFVISALLLASMSANAEEVQYENPELQVKFNLKEVQIENNSILKERDLKKLLIPLYDRNLIFLSYSEIEEALIPRLVLCLRVAKKKSS